VKAKTAFVDLRSLVLGVKVSGLITEFLPRRFTIERDAEQKDECNIYVQ
jgi:hypothetical protein